MDTPEYHDKISIKNKKVIVPTKYKISINEQKISNFIIKKNKESQILCKFEIIGDLIF